MSSFATYAEYKAALAALHAGTATPDQQRACYAHLLAVKSQYDGDLREAERESRDAYSQGVSDAAAEARGEPYGTY